MQEFMRDLLKAYEGNLDDGSLEFLVREFEIFEKPYLRSKAASVEQRQAWRAETVYERKLRLSHEIYDAYDGVVQHGPFKGLQLARNNWWGGYDFGSMIFGLYELEVLDFIHSDAVSGRRHFIDIGAADGYYAVGGLKSGRFDTAHCFEMSAEGRDAIQRNAELNGVASTLQVDGEADSGFFQYLEGLDKANTLVLCDVEGAEFDILTEQTLDCLRGCVVLIEIHNWVDNFFAKYARFISDASKRFTLSTLQPAVRDVNRFAELADLTDDNRYLLCSESRPNIMRFLVLQP